MTFEYTKEEFETLPDNVKDKYVEDGEGYSHGGFLKVKSTANELDNKLKTSLGDLDSYKSAEQERIDEAKKQAHDEAYAQAVKDNDRETLDKLHAEQLEDAKQRAEQRGRELQSQEFKSELANKEADNLAFKIASEIASDNDNAELLQGFIRQQISVDEQGKQTMLNADGSASSLDVKAFTTEFAKQAKYKSLVKTSITAEGGGLANGNNGSRTPVGAPKTLAECKGDRKLETAYFNEQIAQR